MSSVVDVGDAIELTFTTATGSTVTASWLDRDMDARFDGYPVAEDPAGSGKFPFTFLPDEAGVWTAVFTASGASTANERYYVRAEAPPTVPPLAAVGDIAAQFGAMTAAQEQLAAVLVKAASKMIRARYAVDAAMNSGRLDPDVVALGVTNMVLRVMRNPKGLRGETIGPFSRTYDTSHAAGLLVITGDDAACFEPKPIPDWSPPSSVRMAAGLAPPRGWATHVRR